MLRCNKNCSRFRRYLVKQEFGSRIRSGTYFDFNTVVHASFETTQIRTWNIRPTMKTIQPQDTMSPWFVIINSWLKIGAFLPVFFRPGIVFYNHKSWKERRRLKRGISSPHAAIYTRVGTCSNRGSPGWLVLPQFGAGRQAICPARQGNCPGEYTDTLSNHQWSHETSHSCCVFF